MMTKKYSIVGMIYLNAEDFVKEIWPGEKATLMREPNNEHDKNAVAVWVRGRKVGFIPKLQNKALAPMIDRRGLDMAMDQSNTGKAIAATFIRSPNSGYPMVEIE
jgi:HIRAN domain